MVDNHRAAYSDSPAVHRRAEELDALDAILPFDRRDQLAALLTDDDVATLKHLASEGMGENTLRALASDLGYLEAWCQLATGSPLPWPAPEALLLKFVAHHLWDPVKRAEDPAHGMPAEVEAGLRAERLLRADGPHAPGTVRRRLTSWSILTRWRGLTGAFGAPSLKSALRLAVKASNRPRQRKSKKAVTVDILAKLLQACAGDRPVDLRDHALLLTAFASGGRRRSEVAALRVEDLADEEPVRADPSDKTSPPLPCLSIRLGRTKTTTADENEHVLLIGRPVAALKTWLAEALIKDGPVFRRIDQWGNIDLRALTPQSVNLILKARCEQAGLDPALFSAHGLRSGYLTEAANRGIPLPEAMQQSRHKSVTQAASYYNNAERRNGRAARLIV
ncbi:tyrosine-type recombinase/integrase [Sinorhizobium medicae]|uniref:Tyrosine-type recombinase/integrase n=1 Tax=Sinorhizobium medicae TaxID=110321 RepID=A0A6G1WIS8_9HYPH|nr:site-specific integrase [Sinorhizobium medicae]MDX0679977.1 tyrosine-type recombinase/integrase [Sinorhizobium medicae]MDX0712512.1 tyrosine-type recombinase/integrase [Sinorhizobium medicae]MDX0842387.1 tyrosine-type recombinase/integrase [Sinorhizobium medicae]MQV97664.1 tyrosine-type recombinase/integrase [Sinorhizobium medicae]MQW69592.1 tyrosine-type recombinase/integrase [Sinorhizobium medicae]